MRTQELHLGAGRPAADPARPITVVFQGSEGAFSHIAGRRFFGPAPVAGDLSRAADVPRACSRTCASGAADYAMLPIENTTSGSVHDAYDALSHTDLAIVGEEVLRIEMCLVGVADVPLDEPAARSTRTRRRSSQCTAFLASLPQCTVESFIDTAMSVERVKHENDPTHAAIASAEAAALHGLHILRRDIANHRENYTRFLVIAREAEPWDPRVPCKTSVMFVTQHERGALLACLNVLAGHGLNLTKLESRPRPGPAVRVSVLRGLRGQRRRRERPARRWTRLTGLTLSLKIFGSYPARTKKRGERDCPGRVRRGQLRSSDRDVPELPTVGPDPLTARLVRMQRRIDPRDPLENPALEVLHAVEAVLAQQVHGLRAADAGLALHDDVRRVGPCGSSFRRFGSSPSGISVEPVDARDVVLARLAHVEQEHVAAVEPLLQVLDRRLELGAIVPLVGRPSPPA